MFRPFSIAPKGGGVTFKTSTTAIYYTYNESREFPDDHVDLSPVVEGEAGGDPPVHQQLQLPFLRHSSLPIGGRNHLLVQVFKSANII